MAKKFKKRASGSSNWKLHPEKRYHLNKIGKGERIMPCVNRLFSTFWSKWPDPECILDTLFYFNVYTFKGILAAREMAEDKAKRRTLMFGNIIFCTDFYFYNRNCVENLLKNGSVFVSKKYTR